MTQAVAADLPIWAALPVALLLLLGAGLALTGTLGLLRLGSFYERVHAPTLGTTLGIGCVLIASMLYFSVLQTRPVLHEVLIAWDYGTLGAAVGPLVLDGLMVVSGFALLTMSRAQAVTAGPAAKAGGADE